MNCNRFCQCALQLALALGFFHISTGPLFAAKFVVMAVNSGRDITSPFISDPPVLTPGAKGFLIGLDTGEYSGSMALAFQDLTFHGLGLVNFDGIDLTNSNLRYSPKVMTREEAQNQGLDDGDFRRYQRDDTYFIANASDVSWSYDVGPGLEGGEVDGTYFRATAYASSLQPNRVIPAFYVVSTGDLTVSGFIAVNQDGFDVLGNPITHQDYGATARLDFASGTLVAATPPTTPRTLMACAYGGHLYNVDTADGIVEYERPVHTFNLTGIAFSPAGQLFGLTRAVESAPSSLYRINPESGVTTLIGQTGIALLGIGFSPISGDLYCLDGRFLYQLDPSTGHETLISQMDSGDGYFSAMAFDRAGTLYMLNAVMQRLSTVDPMTGTVLSSIPISGISGKWGTDAGMDFDPVTNQLFIATRGPQTTSPSSLFSFDFSTGVATPVGRGLDTTTSLAFVPLPVPEPSTVTIVGSAILCVVLVRWRRRAR